MFYQLLTPVGNSLTLSFLIAALPVLSVVMCLGVADLVCSYRHGNYRDTTGFGKGNAKHGPLPGTPGRGGGARASAGGGGLASRWSRW
jgi:hypothetical protein